MLKVNDAVPAFELENEHGELISSQSLLGSKYILFFYPKDDSPGCTKQACSIRDQFKYINKLGYQVFGVSPDKVTKHKKFIDKYNLPFPLLLDEEKKIIKTANNGSQMRRKVAGAGILHTKSM